MPTLDEQWKELYQEWRPKQEAYVRCLRDLFQDGRVSQERLAECEGLRIAAAEVRKRMDAFIAASLSRNPE